MIFWRSAVPFSAMYFSAAVRMSSGLLKKSFIFGTYQMLTVCLLTNRGLTKCSYTYAAPLKYGMTNQHDKINFAYGQIGILCKDLMGKIGTSSVTFNQF